MSNGSLMHHLVIVLAMISAVVTAQTPPTGGTPLFTAEQIVARAGSERDAASLVQQALRLFLPDQARTDDNTVFVLASQLHAAWLPDLPGVRWVRLNTQEEI